MKPLRRLRNEIADLLSIIVERLDDHIDKEEKLRRTGHLRRTKLERRYYTRRDDSPSWDDRERRKEPKK